MRPSLATIGHHCKKCRFSTVGTLGYQPGNQRFPLQINASSQRLKTHGSQPSNQRLPTIARNCRFLKVAIHGCQPENQNLLLQGIAMVPNLETRGYHCNELLAVLRRLQCCGVLSGVRWRGLAKLLRRPPRRVLCTVLCRVLPWQSLAKMLCRVLCRVFCAWCCGPFFSACCANVQFWF